jgi:hypothetical protein
MENKFAGTPPKLTDVTLLRLVPVMVTTRLVAAEVGENERITGGGM